MKSIFRNCGCQKSTIVLFFLSLAHSFATAQIGPWDLTQLYQTPNWNTTNVDQVDGFTSILYESIDYLGSPAEVYAYYDTPDGTPPTGGWPAVVFAHGGGGTAFTNWVEYWTSKGYAAISMDLEGQYPSGSLTPSPGPSRVGVWGDYNEPIEEQWYYHAVAQIIIAHSLIASFPEVNENKIGMMGISWGGNLTSTVMGVDSRLRWAIPIYGSGFLAGSDGHQGQQLENLDKRAFVNQYYDGSLYYNNVTFPTLWINGTNDFHFALTGTQQSSRAVNGSSTLRYSLGLNHGHGAPLALDEIYYFANSVINGDDGLTQFNSPGINSNLASVTYTTEVGLSSAELVYTLDGEDVIWREKEWQVVNASISGNSISAQVPSNSYAVFFTGTDTRGLLVSSEYLLVEEDNVYEAEDAIISNALVKNDTEASSGEYVDGNTNFNLTFSVVETGEVTLIFRIKSPTGSRSMGVYVNGEKVGTVTTLLSTWNFKSNVTAFLSTGTNTIELRDSEGTAELDVDYLRVVSNTTSQLVHIKKANNTGFAIDGNWGGENAQNVYMWSSNENNENQLWNEIDRGDGYYSYQKYGTNFCLDGNNGGANAQSVYLWECGENNENQQWKKIATSTGTFRLEKRNAPAFALDSGNGGVNGQDLYLWTIGNSNQNQEWLISYVSEPQQKAITTKNSLLMFYPNPLVTNAIMENAEGSTLYIYDVKGNLLITKNILSSSQEIDLHKLTAGIYYAKVTSATSVNILKIVKE